VADLEVPAVAPEWSKFAGAQLGDLSSDDLRHLHRQARSVSLRLAVERELRRRARRQADRHPRCPRDPVLCGLRLSFTAGVAVVVLIPATACSRKPNAS
jgi:uncharacterized protein with von Willebrand factor type A (vWA) domain